MSAPDLDEARAVVVCVLDKLNQLEGLFKLLEHKQEAQDALADIRAYRVTARGFLARLRMAEHGEAGHPHEAPPPPPVPERPNPHIFEKSAYRERNQ